MRTRCVISGDSSLPRFSRSRRIPLLEDLARGASGQMAVDTLLMTRAGRGWEGLLRIYDFHGPCVTVGRTFRGELPSSWLDLCPEVAVRPTGGGAVLHLEDLCFSFFLSPRPSYGAKLFYRIFHGWLNRFLETLSVSASCAGQVISSGGQTAHGVCFDQPVPGDLLSDGRKVLGGALRISGRTLLYQGSLSVPGYRKDDLKTAFREWYPAQGERMLAESLLTGPGRVAGDSCAEGSLSCRA